MNHSHRRMSRLAAIVAAMMLFAGAIASFGSQASAHGDEAHPAHIHVGDCAAPGEVVFPLSNVGSSFDVNGTPTAGSEVVGQDSAIPVDASVTTVAASLADIVAGGHAIVIHESAENIGNYIACGAVGGMMLGDSDLPVGLAPLNDSGYSGIAWLHDNGDGSTDVTVFLTSGEAHGDKAAEGDDGGAVASGDVAIDIADFAYSMPTVEVAVGTTVTWTNQDSTAHTVSQVGGGFESGKIDSDGTFSFTFDTPGTYEYFCQYHPNMKATIVVK